MPQAGVIRIDVRPFDAGLIARWLRRPKIDPGGVFGSILSELLRDDHDILALARKFDRVAHRRRSGSPWTAVEVELTRADAEWLERNGPRPGGLFGSRNRYLPSEFAHVAQLCGLALKKRRGRRRLTGDTLVDAATGRAADPRHLQRLRARIRSEKALRERNSRLGLILRSALENAGP
jgi:hypothetical protein